MIAGRILHKDDTYTDLEKWYDRGYCRKKLMVNGEVTWALVPDKHGLHSAIESIFRDVFGEELV